MVVRAALPGAYLREKKIFPLIISFLYGCHVSSVLGKYRSDLIFEYLTALLKPSYEADEITMLNNLSGINTRVYFS